MDARILLDLVADLKAFFDERSRVEAAAVFGSVARGTATAQSDIDVMVIGEISELRLNTDLAPVGRKYGHRVNAGVWTSDELNWLIADQNTIICSVLAGPLLPLKGVLPTIAGEALPASVVGLLDDSENTAGIEFEPDKLDIKFKQTDAEDDMNN